jgi:pilus assembly protein Flp/PilA
MNVGTGLLSYGSSGSGSWAGDMKEKILGRTRGQGLVEYALILTLVAMVVIAVLSLLGPSVGNVFSMVVCLLTQENTVHPPYSYGSLLLPIMVGVTGFGAGVSHLWRKRSAAVPQS